MKSLLIVSLVSLSAQVFGMSDTEVVVYLAEPLETKKGSMPACTPVALKVGKKSIVVRDLNQSWPRVKLKAARYESIREWQKFDQCLADVPAYLNKYNDSHLAMIAEGRLSATMPVEFALMIMGPPTSPPSFMSMVNPLTGQPESINTYVWINLWGNRKTLRSVFMVLGTAALGVGAVASDLGTTVNALTVANAANLATWALSDFSKAKFVTVASKNGSIYMVTAS